MLKVYVPSATVPVVSSPFTVTLFRIFRLPYSISLFSNSGVVNSVLPS